MADLSKQLRLSLDLQDLDATLWEDKANYLQDFSRGSDGKKGLSLLSLIVSNFKNTSSIVFWNGLLINSQQVS